MNDILGSLMIQSIKLQKFLQQIYVMMMDLPIHLFLPQIFKLSTLILYLQSQLLMLQQILIALTIIAAILIYAYTRIDNNLKKDKEYYELTLFLGSGGHTGQLCRLLNQFNIQKVNKLNVVLSSSDKSSQPFFRKYLEENHPKYLDQVIKRCTFYYILRAKEVKQSKHTVLFTIILSLLDCLRLVTSKLMNTTHVIANGPGTCVPLFYFFFLFKMIKFSRVKLIFFESWCRVQDLSLTGKIIKPIASEFIVHWPELASKYKDCKYFQQII